MKIKSFYRGSSTLKCRVCERATRDTGNGDICEQCFELAGMENEISDGHATEKEHRDRARFLVGQLEAKGVDTAEWKETFGL